MANRLLVVNRSREDPAEFDVRFARCYRLLYFLAGRILGGTNGAEDAVENCRLTASRNPPRFEYESAFRSCLVRVLIDEALALLRENKKKVSSEVAFARRFPQRPKPIARKQSRQLEAATGGEY
jgi:DNA-directed RNA polymerase specialized sigma24 family protein